LRVWLPLLFRRKLGDGRYFIMIWLFIWMMTFSFTGGKFTRYFTVALPAVLITAAIGIQFLSGWISERLSPEFPLVSEARISLNPFPPYQILVPCSNKIRL